MFDLHMLTIWQILLSLSIGIILSLIYLFLLWKTLVVLPKIKHKGNFLFLSAIVRLALLIFAATYFSFENGARFLLIFIGFILTRLIVTKYVKTSVRKIYEKRQSDKNTKDSKK